MIISGNQTAIAEILTKLDLHLSIHLPVLVLIAEQNPHINLFVDI